MGYDDTFTCKIRIKIESGQALNSGSKFVDREDWPSGEGTVV